MFYLTTHSTHFIYGYMASDIRLRTILIVRKETCCHHICYSFKLAARVLLYAPSHRQDSTYHGLCYTSCEALAGTRNSSMGPPHEGSIRRPIAPWANALTNRAVFRKKGEWMLIADLSFMSSWKMFSLACPDILCYQLIRYDLNLIPSFVSTYIWAVCLNSNMWCMLVVRC